MAPSSAAGSCPAGELAFQDVLAFALCYEVLYQIFKFAFKSSPHEKVAQLGASYSVAFINATVCSVGGFWAMASLLAGSYADRLAVTEAPSVFWPGAAAGVAVYERFAHSFLGWLAYDVVHVFTNYPKLGGADTAAHHLGFVCLTCLGSVYRVLPFPVAWLLVGELSSLPLNVRWFLINTGRGKTSALTYTNYAFALSFFVMRVVVFWAGVAHLLLHLRPSLLGAPYLCKPWVVNTLCGFISAGALLNGYWFINIVKMATRGGEKPAAKTA